MLGPEQVYPGRYDPNTWWSCGARRRWHFSTACRPSCKWCSTPRPPKASILAVGNRSSVAAPSIARCMSRRRPWDSADRCVWHVRGAGPLVSCAHLNEELLAGSEDERITYRIKAGVPGPLVDAAMHRQRGQLPARRRRVPGRAGAACAVAQRGLFQRAAEGRRAMGRRLDAHRGCGHAWMHLA